MTVKWTTLQNIRLSVIDVNTEKNNFSENKLVLMSVTGLIQGNSHFLHVLKIFVSCICVVVFQVKGLFDY